MAQSEALEAWLVWSRHLRASKSPPTLSQSMQEHWSYVGEETAFGQANISRGLTSPIAGKFENPLPNGSQAIGRAVYWGLAFRDKPDDACRHAYYDASADHAEDGVACAVAVARMVSLAKPGISPAQLVKAAAAVLPPGSLTLKVLPLVLKSLENPDGAADLARTAADTLQVPDGLHAGLSLGWIMVSLLHCKNDFSKAVRTAAGCGGATDQVALATGAIAGLLGYPIAPEWMEPLGTEFVAGHGLKNLDPPTTLGAFVQQVTQDAATYGRPEPEPVPPAAEAPAEAAAPIEAPASTEPVAAATEVTPAAPEDQAAPQTTDAAEEAPTAVTEPQPVVVVPEPIQLKPDPTLLQLINKDQDESITEVEGVRLSAQYVDPPMAKFGFPMRLVLTFTNMSDTEKVLETSIKGPDGWKLASRLTGFRLRPGESSSFPAVAQPDTPDIPSLSMLKLRMNRYEFNIPVLGPQRWYWAGPFVNHDGTGFEKVFPCENDHRTGSIFNGRSDLPVKWEEESFAGCLFDVEPMFKTGPGVIYLLSKLKFPKPGTYKIVVATPVGTIAWADYKRLLWYHDVHVPVPRVKAPYVAEFETQGESEIMVKVLRNRQAIAPTVIYFVGEDGQVVTPQGFGKLEG